MANKNCLANMACPECGSLGPYKIEAKCDADVDDNGIDTTENFQWEADSPCTCKACSHDALVRDFYVSAESE